MLTERFKKTIFRELKISPIELDGDLKAFQVPGWDSLTHACVIDALEKEYKVRLKNMEILNCKNLGELMQLIHSKTETL
ncbi:MAG: hypothetical protein BWY70_00426 [Bacteroidetes bacterium ADurb.Bin408]|nr:MAG: hypothetical protein BWY70_00426 [Bacteroidetes bacterium ADurb.Bin408]